MPTSGMILKSRSEHLNANIYKDHINALLMVATLVATVTFAAGFTLPGGFNSSAPNMGMAILAYKFNFRFYLVFNTLAMQSSIVAIVALIWAQLGDLPLVHRAFHMALPSLFVALISMSLAFLCGVLVTLPNNGGLVEVITIISTIFLCVILFLLAPHVIPQVPRVPFLRGFTRAYLEILLTFVKEDGDDGKHQTSKVDFVGSSGAEKAET